MIFPITSNLIQNHIESLPYESKYTPVIKNMLDKVLEWKTPNSLDGVLNRTLQGYFILAKMLQSIIIIDDKIVYQFGIGILSSDKLMELYSLHKEQGNIQEKSTLMLSSVKAAGLDYDLYIYSLDKKSNILYIVPTQYKPDWNDLEPILAIIQNYYCNFPVPQDINKTVNLISKSIQAFLSDVDVMSQRGVKNLVVSRFFIQNLRPYYNAIAEENTMYVLEYIKDEIQKRLSQDSLIYRISQKDLVALSPDSSIDELKLKIGDIFLQFKYLIISYKVSYVVIDNLDVVDENYIYQLISDAVQH